MIVRRVHLHAQDDQTELFTYWRHFAFVSNRSESMHEVDAAHRQHAQVEQVIRDLKDQALAHFPSGHYSANSAWTVIVCLAHNLGCWTNLLGLTGPTPRAARTLRRRLFALPGRLTRTARRQTLNLPARWPWQTDFIEALTRIRALPPPPDQPPKTTSHPAPPAPLLTARMPPHDQTEGGLSRPIIPSRHRRRSSAGLNRPHPPNPQPPTTSPPDEQWIEA